MNLIKTIQRFIADIRQAVNDPYSCLDEEGVKMMREIEEMEKQAQNSPPSKLKPRTKGANKFSD